MNWDQIEGKWAQFKGSAQAQWGKLTDDQLDVAAGNRQKLEGEIQEAYGKTKEEAEREVDEWLSRQ
ncbi:CsbD family protein [Donghicola sp. XS_ASV15]|uniref:CsbD family protein n=1 Tax=Donghicola sp. XS_ASV15 TaxID=3241295 RepID=UPI00351535FF